MDISPFLGKIRGPSRYLGLEVNACRKSWDAARVRMCLAFPDVYEVGTSHFGMQILYHVVNLREGWLADRVFCPDRDLEEALVRAGQPLWGLETRQPLGDFDVIGFSLLYELNATNVLTILERAGLPFRAGDREGTHPLVIGGGPVAVNPEPYADFFDALVVGDGEEVLPRLLEILEKWKAAGEEKKGLLKAWSQVEGVYVPGLYDRDPQTGFARGPAVRRAIVANLDEAPFPDRPVVPFSPARA